MYNFLYYFLCTFLLGFGGIPPVLPLFFIYSKIVLVWHLCPSTAFLCRQQENCLKTICCNSCRKSGLSDAPTPRQNAVWCCAPFCAAHFLIFAFCTHGVRMYFAWSIRHFSFRSAGKSSSSFSQIHLSRQRQSPQWVFFQSLPCFIAEFMAMIIFQLFSFSSFFLPQFFAHDDTI